MLLKVCYREFIEALNLHAQIVEITKAETTTTRILEMYTKIKQ